MKRIAGVGILLALWLFAAAALAEITVTRDGLNAAQGLDKNVSNILVLMQDGARSETIMLASINNRTGRSVMTRLNSELMVTLPEVGDVALGDVYALGAEKSRGLLAARTVNTLLGLNVNTYIAFDITRLPELVAMVGALNMQFDAQEAAYYDTWEGINELTGDQVLDYVRLKLPDDDPARSRGYDALMQLLYQGMHTSNLFGMVSLGGKLLGSMDNNLNAMTAVAMVTAVQGGTDRRELLLPAVGHITQISPLQADAEAMRRTLHGAIYE